MDASTYPHGQGGAAEMAEARLHRKSNPVPHRGRHAARRHHLAHAGEPDFGRTGTTPQTTLPRKHGRRGSLSIPKINLIRYADDFIITGATKDVLENEVKPLVEQFLRDRGLQLSPEKTCITHIEQGFDFLGQNLRKFDGKLLIKPSKKNTHVFLEKVRGIIRCEQIRQSGKPDTSTQPGHPGLGELPPSHRGGGDVPAGGPWIWHRLWRWAKRRHPEKSLPMGERSDTCIPLAGELECLRRTPEDERRRGNPFG